jgi:S-formylglutathione hydrolase FrmB
MRKSFERLGEVHRLRLRSELLRGNRAGDPSDRDVLVYTPPGYDASRRYPLLVDLIGYTGSGASHTNWRPFGYSLPERLDRLISTGAMPAAIVALPDCFTVYGGNQYIDSTATGPYLRYLVEEVVPLVEKEFPAGGERGRRGVFGKSSGGYGALMHAMRASDTWGAAVCHSGDAYFEWCYLREAPQFLAQVLKHGGSVEKFLDAVWGKEKVTSDEMHALMFVGMAAHYDPDPEAPLGFQLPVDVRTGEIRWDRWERWLQHDPVRLLDRHAADLKRMKLLWIDCGTKDQYALLWGARMLHDGLDRLGVSHVYEEFDDDHSDVDYRMERSLPALAKALS